MKHLNFYLFILLLTVAMCMSFAACDCEEGDDDDDHKDEAPDDDDDDDVVDDDDDDDDNDDVTPPPLRDLIPPVDYDGDGNEELLLWSVKETVTDLVYGYDLVEPGTFERTNILEYSFSTKKGFGGVGLDVMDFDMNSVWDLIVLLPDLSKESGKEDYPIIQIFMNGDFDNPAFTIDNSSADGIFTQTMDINADGHPELLVQEFFSSPNDYTKYTFFDSTKDWAEVFSIGDSAYGEMELEGTIRRGDLFESAGNFSGEANALELLGVRYYTDGGTKYVQMIIFDASTGVETTASVPIDLGEANFTNHDVADFDNDGVTEILVGKNYELNTAKGVHYSQAIVYGGKNFDIEYQSSQVSDYHMGLFTRRDINMDNVLDPVYILRSASDNAKDYYGLDGTDGYSQLFSHSSLTTINTTLIPYPGRAFIYRGYYFTGQGSPELVIQEVDHSVPPSIGQFRILNLDTSALSDAKHPVDLGDLGYAISMISDLGKDGVMDLTTKIKKKVTTAKGTVEHIYVYVLTGENMDEAFSIYLGADVEYDFYNFFDLTGDHKADLFLHNYGSDPMEIKVYDCVGGCSESGTMIANTGEWIMFLGPFL